MTPTHPVVDKPTTYKGYLIEPQYIAAAPAQVLVTAPDGRRSVKGTDVFQWIDDGCPLGVQWAFDPDPVSRHRGD